MPRLWHLRTDDLPHDRKEELPRRLDVLPGLMARCQEDRRRTVNRFLALRELVDRVEMEISPQTSRRLVEIERRRRNKARAGRRARVRAR